MLVREAEVWITPHSEDKVELLKVNNYQYATRRFSIPHSSEQPEDRAWRMMHLPAGEEERTRRENANAEENRQDHLARELASRRSLKVLGDGIVKASARAGKVSPQLVGRYMERNQFLYIVGSERILYITPTTPEKLKLLVEAGYFFPEKIEPLPYFTDKEEDLKWIKNNLPEGEYEKCEQERKNLADENQENKIKLNMEKLQLRAIPENISKRGMDSGKTDPKNIGRIGVFRGVMAWVAPDERVYVSWYTPNKQEDLEECGYKLEGYMPIKVPYAMADMKQRRWLMENLPEADDDEQISVDENGENL